MTTIRRAVPTDLLKMNLTNLDPLTENYDVSFYFNYLAKWPGMFQVIEDWNAGIIAYSMVHVRMAWNMSEANQLQSWASLRSRLPRCATLRTTPLGMDTLPC